ncbi:MAG TPA: hypothetical protein VN768_05180 [Acidimicrobiales bacterium]|nr:hypothetical protein [Acidimicrobiales bacterium]
MRTESDEWVTLVANGILASIVKEANASGVSGPFSLDAILRAWLEHDAPTVAKLPDPPGKVNSSISQRRTYWFYEGCQALEEGARIAEVGEGKFAIASFKVLMGQSGRSPGSSTD